MRNKARIGKKRFIIVLLLLSILIISIKTISAGSRIYCEGDDGEASKSLQGWCNCWGRCKFKCEDNDIYAKATAFHHVFIFCGKKHSSWVKVQECGETRCVSRNGNKYYIQGGCEGGEWLKVKSESWLSGCGNPRIYVSDIPEGGPHCDDTEYDPDLNSEYCDTCDLTWTDYGDQRNCCGDDSGETWCGTGYGACLNGVYKTGGDVDPFVCECGQGLGYWNLGGEVADANKCCENDPGENRVEEKSGEDAPPGYNSGDTTCCSHLTDCTDDDVCFTSGEPSSKIIPTKAYCNAGTWEGGDASNEACVAIGGKWVGGAKCCGDDNVDCGLVGSGYLCYLDTAYRSPAWYSTSTYIGDIKYVLCNDREYLADGTTWQKCDNAWWKKIVLGHSYACNGAGKESIFECCGSTNCYSAGSDGKRKTTGGSIDSTARYYCSEYYDWITDLDEIYRKGDTDGTTCNLAKDPSGTDEDFVFTTTLCCGDDGALDTYSDPAVDGNACWEGNIVNHCSELVNNDRTLNENGTLYGCNAEQLTSRGHCSLMCSGNFYCSFDEDKWKDSEGRARNKSSTWNGGGATLQTECCEQDKCWNGEICVDNQANDPTSQPYNSWRCIDGVWKEELSPKITPTGDKGYCPQDSQCLVDINGDYADNNLIDGNDDGIINPQCIADGQYIMDLYCENGKWTSRTKHVALQLLSIPTTNDYTLFCDRYESALNYVGYTVVTDIAENYFTWGKVNEFCVLVYEGNVIIGASLNRDVNAETYSFLETIGKPSSYCNNALDGEDDYVMCSNNRLIWYNDKMGSIIYSDASLFLESPVGSSVITNHADYLIDYIVNNVHDNPYDYTSDDIVNVESTRWYDRLFIGRLGSYSVFGLLEAPNQGREYMAIDHQGLSTDVCSYVEAYDAAESSIDHVYCSNDRYVVSRDFINENDLLEYFSTADIWLDLTAKLRLE